MNVNQVISKLNIKHDENYLVKAIIRELDREYHINGLGRHDVDIPCVSLSIDKPLHPEKKVIGITEEFSVFLESEFTTGDSEIYLDIVHKLNEKQYESRFYNLTDITFENNIIFLVASSCEEKGMRDKHNEPDPTDFE